MNIIDSIKRLTKFEKSLWLFSAVTVSAGFLLCGGLNVLALVASLVGVTALIFVAKGDLLGQALIILFAVLYAIISWQFRYYGEMITYLGMTAPISVLALISWRRNPYSEGQVKVGKMTARKAVLLCLTAGLVTWGFYYVLAYLNTSNLFFSTVSITTSFFAVSLTVLRSPGYAIAYAANDVVLIILWVLAALEDISFLPLVICFALFFINDLYGFASWQRMKRLQAKGAADGSPNAALKTSG